MEFGDEEVRQAPLALRIWVPRRSVRGKLGSRATRRVCFAEVVRNGGWEHRAIENRAAPCTVSIFADAATSRLTTALCIDAEWTFAIVDAKCDYLASCRKPIDRIGGPARAQFRRSAR